jgi:hypothetical protein
LAKESDAMLRSCANLFFANLLSQVSRFNFRGLEGFSCLDGELSNIIKLMDFGAIFNKLRVTGRVIGDRRSNNKNKEVLGKDD